MAVTISLIDAAQTLGLTGIEDPASIKAAYRRLLVLHPPDRDPEGFRRIRSAFEALKDPGVGARDRLLRPLPASDPPRLAAAEPAAVGMTAVAVLRLIAAQAEPRALLKTTPGAGEDAS